MVSIQRTATLAKVPTFGQFLSLDGAATATRLAGVSGVYEHYVSSGPFSLEGTILDELTPTSIQD